MGQHAVPGGETLKLGPPTAGDVTIYAGTGGLFTFAVQHLQPGTEIPVRRARDWDEVWFVHKGQARATVGERSMTVVPGAVLSSPRQTWFGLRNTGTGILEMLVACAPSGVEGLYRDLSKLGQAPSPSAVQEVAQRYGIEFQAPGQAASPAPTGGGRRRHRRGGRGGGRGGSEQRTHPVQAPPSAPSAPVEVKMTAAPAGAASGAPSGEGRRRRRRRRGGVGGQAGAAAPQAPTTAAGATSPAPKAQRPQSSPPSGGSKRPRGGRDRRGGHSRRVKEVYMNGRWVQVSGEGPVIASGESAEERRARHHQVEDGGPGGPLSVPL